MPKPKDGKMQLTGKKKTTDLDSIGEGSVSLLPTEPEDMVSSSRPAAPRPCHAPTDEVSGTQTTLSAPVI